ncbi:unnamed protein product [Symbiodinium sp. KB8]|nr:unnamed protein product [Symbiodinium sp. KB8]
MVGASSALAAAATVVAGCVVAKRRSDPRPAVSRATSLEAESEVLEDEDEEEESDEEEEIPPLEFDESRAEGIIAAVQDARKQQQSAAVLLQERKLITDEASAVQALRALRLSGMDEEVLNFFLDFESLTATPEAYYEKLSAMIQMGMLPDTFSLLEELRQSEVRLDLACYNLILKIHALNRSTKSATEMLEEMRQNSLKPDVHSYDFALASCNSRKKWENIITLLDQMQEDGVAMNNSCYHTVLHGLSYSPDYHERCFELYISMRENGITPNETQLCSLLRALFGEEGQERDRKKGLEIFQQLVDDTSVNLTEVHFDMAINVCEKDGLWREILSLATAMGSRGISPHSMTCNAVLKACVQLGKSDVALKLLGTMARDGTELDRVAYRTVLAACARARSWDEVLKLYAEVEAEHPSFLGPDLALPAITAMCEVGRNDEAIALYRETFGGMLAQQQTRPSGSDPIVLDARRLSPQVGGILMRCALEDAVARADATAARAAPRMALAGFPPSRPKDILIAVNAADLDDESALPGSTAEMLLQGFGTRIAVAFMIPVCRVSGLLAVALAGTGSWPHGAVDVMRPNAKPNLRALFDWHAADGHLDERGLTRLLRVQQTLPEDAPHYRYLPKTENRFQAEFGRTAMEWCNRHMRYRNRKKMQRQQPQPPPPPAGGYLEEEHGTKRRLAVLVTGIKGIGVFNPDQIHTKREGRSVANAQLANASLRQSLSLVSRLAREKAWLPTAMCSGSGRSFFKLYDLVNCGNPGHELSQVVSPEQFTIEAAGVLGLKFHEVSWTSMPYIIARHMKVYGNADVDVVFCLKFSRSCLFRPGGSFVSAIHVPYRGCEVGREVLGAEGSLECQQTPFPSVRVPGLSLQSLLVQQVQQVVSKKLTERLLDAGVPCLADLLSNLGVNTFGCLGKLTADEFSEIVGRVRAAGFGPGHACNLKSLHLAAKEETTCGMSPLGDVAPPVAVGICEKLQSMMKLAGLDRMQAVIAQNGVTSFACLEALSVEELQEIRESLLAAGFEATEIQALCELRCAAPGPSPLSPGRKMEAERSSEVPISCKHKASDEDKENEERPRKILKSTDDVEARPSTAPFGAAPTDAVSESGSDDRRREPARATKVLPSKLDSVPLISDDRKRLTRQRIETTLSHSKAIQAQVVKYRDRASGKLVEARIPSAVLALLRLRASCSGPGAQLTEWSRGKMEEHAFDPVRAVAALSPSSLLCLHQILCPTGALRVLGSGFIGTVFLEEVLVSADACVGQGTLTHGSSEGFFLLAWYDLCRAFASANLAPSPISLDGPCCAKGCRGLRHGLSPPDAAVAKGIGSAMVRAFQDLFDAGLVHGEDRRLQKWNLCTWLDSLTVTVAVMIGVLPTLSMILFWTDVESKPAVQLIDFGRSASKEYDVCRFVTELCQAFDELQYEFEETIQECQKELRELKRTKEATSPVADWELHVARQIAGLQAFLEEEPKGLERVEMAFDTVLGAVLRYAVVRLELPVEGTASIRNRRMRQAQHFEGYPGSGMWAQDLVKASETIEVCKKRETACHKIYFKSDLFWADIA